MDREHLWYQQLRSVVLHREVSDAQPILFAGLVTRTGTNGLFLHPIAFHHPLDADGFRTTHRDHTIEGAVSIVLRHDRRFHHHVWKGLLISPSGERFPHGGVDDGVESGYLRIDPEDLGRQLNRHHLRQCLDDAVHGQVWRRVPVGLVEVPQHLGPGQFRKDVLAGEVVRIVHQRRKVDGQQRNEDHREEQDCGQVRHSTLID